MRDLSVVLHLESMVNGETGNVPDYSTAALVQEEAIDIRAGSLEIMVASTTVVGS